MKTKEEALTDGFYDSMYSTKTIKEVLGEAYEHGFANGFKQGNDNAREVAALMRKKQIQEIRWQERWDAMGWHKENGFSENYTPGEFDMSELEKDVRNRMTQKQINWTELTWKDIVELEGIINNVHYDYSNGIGQESFGKEVLDRFRSTKGIEYLDEAEQKWYFEEKAKDMTELEELKAIKEELENYFEGYWPGLDTPEQCNTLLRFTPPAIVRLVEHFYNFGKDSVK